MVNAKILGYRETSHQPQPFLLCHTIGRGFVACLIADHKSFWVSEYHTTAFCLLEKMPLLIPLCFAEIQMDEFELH